MYPRTWISPLWPQFRPKQAGVGPRSTCDEHPKRMADNDERRSRSWRNQCVHLIFLGLLLHSWLHHRSRLYTQCCIEKNILLTNDCLYTSTDNRGIIIFILVDGPSDRKMWMMTEREISFGVYVLKYEQMRNVLINIMQFHILSW